MAPQGRDLPDAKGPWFVVLIGRFGGANQSAGGHERNFSDLKSAPQSSLLRDSQESRAPDSKALARHSPTCAGPDIAVAASYYVSWFVSTGKNDWKPPKMD